MAGTGATLVACSDLFGNSGGDWVTIPWLEGSNGNFSADPLFCGDPTGGQDLDYSLRSDSPCASENSNGCGLVGALPVACGPVALEAETWAGVKARYRGGE